MRTSFSIRSATESDLSAISGIYNHYVLSSTCTYQEELESLEDRKQWFNDHDERHPIIVAEANGNVVGWASLSPFHKRSAYRRTVENSVYVDHQHHRLGVGSLLLQELITRARALEYRAIIAGIDGDQAASIRLHIKFRFKKVGHLEQVGFKFGRWLDVIYMELQPATA
jgi:L-amino acid N-acyltransferase YncA